MSSGTETIALHGRLDPGTHWATYVRYPFHPGYSAVGIVVAAARADGTLGIVFNWPGL